MADPDLKSLDPVTKEPPECRVKDAFSLNGIVKKILLLDTGSALSRVDVQKMMDGTPPFSPIYMQDSGQAGRCNLNFGDGKAMVKAEMAGYYDLTDSVPVLAMIETDYGLPNDPQRSYYNQVLSEEFHRLLKDWKSFDKIYQLLIQRFVTHGLGFLYFKDDMDWRWECAGLEDFKLPRTTTMNEDECDIACVFKDVTVGKLYSWIKDVPDNDTRWNKKEVKLAIMNAADSVITAFSDGMWEKWQSMAKNNDIYASTTAQDNVHLAHAWVREFSGRVSQYLTLRNGLNTDFLYKCENRFEGTEECFTFFPYEVSTNGLLHAVRGKAHEIYAPVQVLNTMRCQTVDNARLSGSLLLQPKTETDAQDMALLFYGGATYLPPNVEIKNVNLGNPSTSILPVIRDMTLLMTGHSGETAKDSADSGTDKSKFEVRAQLQKEAKLPTASMNMFYQPWGRHLTEVWRRARNKKLNKTDPGAEMVFEMRARIVARGVPEDAIYMAKRVQPMRAIGYGSPASRMLALDEFMQYFGSLDPVGQNNLLRDWYAQRVGYSQVDRYVPKIDENGRAPLDQEVAECQNIGMSEGTQMSVIPNDHHIIHLLAHLPSLTNDLDQLESGQGTPELLTSTQVKVQHIADHMHLLKPDKLNEKIVAELERQFNNAAERVKAAVDHAQRAQAKQQQKDAQELQQRRQQEQQGPSPAAQQAAADGELRRKGMQEDHDLNMRLTQEEAHQRGVIEDSKNAQKMRADAARERFRNTGKIEPDRTPPAPAASPQPMAPAAPAGVIPPVSTGP